MTSDTVTRGHVVVPNKMADISESAGARPTNVVCIMPLKFDKVL
jgi:hypothetical protein